MTYRPEEGFILHWGCVTVAAILLATAAAVLFALGGRWLWIVLALGLGLVVLNFLVVVLEESSEDHKARGDSSLVRALLEFNGSMGLAHDLSGRLVDVSEGLCTQSGYAREELVGNHLSMIEKTLRPGQTDGLWHRIQPGKTMRLEGLTQRKDGSEFPTRVHVTRLSGADEEVIYAHMVNIEAEKAANRRTEYSIMVGRQAKQHPHAKAAALKAAAAKNYKACMGRRRPRSPTWALRARSGPSEAATIETELGRSWRTSVDCLGVLTSPQATACASHKPDHPAE